MGIVIREYQTEDLTAAITIWNQVVEDGVAFPQEENLTEETGDAFFKEQTYTGIAVNTDNNEIVGLYILHPNNVGRCGHICNASYAVRREVLVSRFQGCSSIRVFKLDKYKLISARAFSYQQIIGNVLT